MTESEWGDDARVVAMEANMVAQGVATTERVQADYFGFEETHRVVLPDGISFIEHKVLNEGARRRYLNSVNRDVKFQKATGDAIMRIASGDEKGALLKAAIVGWGLSRAGQPVAFNPRNLDEFLEKAPPKVIDLIHKDVQRANDWLVADVTVEDIDREIADLQEMRAKKLDEEAGKGASVR